MESTISGKRLLETYWSLAEFADTADKRAGSDESGRIRDRVNDGDDAEWMGGITSWDDGLKLARLGWQDALPEALAIAESAVETANKDHMVDSFSQPVWDVTGAQVDVGAYLAGTPECMIDYPLSTTSKAGRVVTLVASMSMSAAIEPETVIRRGQVTVALALALSQLGHAVEIWLDFSVNPLGKNSGPLYQRVCVKGADDELDPALIMFAYAHPGMLRVIAFGAWEGLPKQWKEYGHGARGLPAKRTAEIEGMFPEGTIFLPELRSSRDVPEAGEFLRKHLGDLGLLAE